MSNINSPTTSELAPPSPSGAEKLRPAKLYPRVRKQAKRWFRFLFSPKISTINLHQHLDDLEVRVGGLVLVHSSLSAFGHFKGGVKQFIQAIVDYLGPEGTLMMPSHCWSQVNRGLRTFDLRESQSCVGAVSEEFRHWEGAVRSLHPSHSVTCVGRNAHDLISEHELADSPCGYGTPYAKLMELNGQIVLLGVPLRRNTCFHAIESMAQVSYLMRPEKMAFQITDYSGSPRELQFKCHAPAVPSRFNELYEELETHGIARTSDLGNGRSLCIEALPFRDYLLPLLQKNERYLLSD